MAPSDSGKLCIKVATFYIHIWNDISMTKKHACHSAIWQNNTELSFATILVHFKKELTNKITRYFIFKWGRKLVMDVLCADEKRQEMPWNYRMLLLRNVEFGTASISTKRMIFRKLDTKVLRSIGQHFKAFILLPICYHDIYIIFLSIFYFRSSKEIINLKNQLFHYIKSNEFWYQFYGS